MDTKTAITALAALAQDMRLAVFRYLVTVGPQGIAASKIAEHLSVPPSTLSFHLKELTHAGLIVARPHLAPAAWRAMSAGSQPAGYVHPLPGVFRPGVTRALGSRRPSTCNRYG